MNSMQSTDNLDDSAKRLEGKSAVLTQDGDLPVTESPAGGTLRIPLIDEQVQVDKQTNETGRVRLVKTVEEYTETIQTPLMHENIVVERVPIGRYVDEMPTVRQEGDVTVYPVLEEVIVVEKRIRLVEELRVTKRQVETIDEQTVSLRREVVNVERDAPLS